MSDTVLLHIHRKAQFRAALLPYFIHVNGRFVGKLTSGAALNVNVPKADCYLIEEGTSLMESVLFRPEADAPLYTIEVRTAGGWAKPTRPVFMRHTADGLEELPAAFDSIRETYIRKRAESSLSEKERILLRCYEFWISFSDDVSLGEVAAQPNVNEMMDALRTVGALRLAEFCEKGFKKVLGDIILPIEDVSDYEEQLAALDRYGSEADRQGKVRYLTDELRACIALFALGK